MPSEAWHLLLTAAPAALPIAAACAGMAKAMGFQVDYYGILPTPALALQALKNDVPAIIITGSHVPFDRNGMKFYRPDVENSKADELQITACTAPLIPFTPELPSIATAAQDGYGARYLKCFQLKCLEAGE